ncbi:MAG: hypothetical protein FJW35_03505 [Acidobacteria bacterium]|nr:hypothetical protein [Acidobacteriota bacterium]
MVDLPNVERASENLQFIRRTLEAAGQFTAVPGKAVALVGGVALVGAGINQVVTGAPWQDPVHPHPALDVWGCVLAISMALIVVGIRRKTLVMNIPLQMPLIRKLLWSLCPALFVGAVLTNLAVHEGQLAWLPAIWLGCYGAAVASAGQVSIAPLRILGVCLLAAAAGAAVTPAHLGLTWISLGFGWMHVFVGAYIAWRYHG